MNRTGRLGARRVPSLTAQTEVPLA